MQKTDYELATAYDRCFDELAATKNLTSRLNRVRQESVDGPPAAFQPTRGGL